MMSKPAPNDDDLNDENDGILFRFWCRAASFPGGWPGRLSELMNQEITRDGFATPAAYRRALMLLAEEKGVNLR